VFSQNRLPLAEKNSQFLFKTPETDFQPTYYQIGEFYNSKKVRILLQVLNYISKRLWKLLVWPRFVNRALIQINTHYFKHMNWDNDIPFKQTKAEFFNAIKYCANRQPSAIINTPITDFLNVFGHSLQVYFMSIKGHRDIFFNEKQSQNDICAPLYVQLRSEQLLTDENFDHLIFLITRANWIDSFDNLASAFLTGFHDEVNEIMASQNINQLVAPLLGQFDSRKLFNYLKQKKRHILYELDNSGEVYFDLLLIEYLLKNDHHVTIVAKKEPCLNDVTLTDLRRILDHEDMQWHHTYLNTNQLSLIHNGSINPGKTLATVSHQYKTAYMQSDLVILKGQGNFQTMPIGRTTNNQFRPFSYKSPIMILMGIKSNLILYSLTQLYQKKCPEMESIMAYFFDPLDPHTFPS
jgi:uncharacterized protein with ATP-grasp and redox domains